MPPLHNNHAVDLLKELQDHNAFFDDLVDMFPAKLYIPGNSGDDAYNPKYYKGQHKESREARRARNKASKRQKFHPTQSETTRQVQDRLATTTAATSATTGPPPTTTTARVGAVLLPPTSSSSNSNDTSVATTTTTTSSTVAETNVPTTSSTSRIEVLRAKLHAKLAEKALHRPNSSSSSSSDPSVAISKRAARRAEKQRRKHMQRQQQQSKKKKTKTASQVQAASTGLAMSQTETTASNTIVDDLETMDFGTLAGLNPIPKPYQNNKALANLGGGGGGGKNKKRKNLEKLLADAQEKKLRLEELKRGTDEQRAEAQQVLWTDTLKEASGQRVKDDPTKLRKELKRKVAKKVKSTKAWRVRMDQVKEKMDDRQRIRKHNLEKRKLGGTTGANLSKKRMVVDDDVDHDGKNVDGDNNNNKQRGRSRRLSRAGFEGKKQDFLNQKGSKKNQ